MSHKAKHTGAAAAAPARQTQQAAASASAAAPAQPQQPAHAAAAQHPPRVAHPAQRVIEFVPHAIASSQHKFDAEFAFRRFLLPIDYSVWPDADLLLQAQIRDPTLSTLARDQGTGALSEAERDYLVQKIARGLPRRDWFLRQVGYLSDHLDPIHINGWHQKRSLWDALHHWQCNDTNFEGLQTNQFSSGNYDQQTRQATKRINAVLYSAPQVKECVLFHGLQLEGAIVYLEKQFRFSGAQRWMPTSYDIAVASWFAEGSAGVILAIHITKESALWVSSHLMEHQHNHDAYHERELLLYVHGKRFQKHSSLRVPALQTMMPYVGDDRRPLVIVVTLVDAVAPAQSAAAASASAATSASAAAIRH
jgi:hypothetical protein